MRQWGVAVLCAMAATDAAAGNCRPSGIDEYAHVAYVYDGDTVRLDDGRHIRLIGINTPEVSHRGSPSQPFAVKAKKALIRLLSSHQWRVGLQYDAEHFDKYHRVLAHLYVARDRSVEAWLLERGLATILIIPPNVDNAACYQAVERVARGAERGLWALPAYRATEVARLSSDSRGYRIIRGAVTRVGHSAHAVWVDLGGKVELEIKRGDLPYLRPLDPDALLHKRVIARGWLHGGDNGGLWMRVRYRSALQLTASTPD